MSTIALCLSVAVVLDEQKSGVDREVSELRASLREVETGRLQALQDVHDARRQLSNVDAERRRLIEELGELQARVARSDRLNDAARRDNSQLRQKVRDRSNSDTTLVFRARYCLQCSDAVGWAA